MPVQGTLKADELRIAQLTLDRTKNPTKLQVLAAMIDTGTGDTRAWIPASGNIWSKETQELLKDLLEQMEEDIARSVLGDSSSSKKSKGLQPPSGIGEHVKNDDVEATSI